MKEEDFEIEPWEVAFKRAKHNPIYFLELFYNKAYPDKAVTLTDDEKHKLFEQYRGVPVFKEGSAATYLEYEERLEKLRAQGYKDWEIL